MNDMFYYCESLTYLDLSSFNLENLKNSDNMFLYCVNLKEIKFNPLSSPSAGAPALNYGNVFLETSSSGEVKGLIIIH